MLKPILHNIKLGKNTAKIDFLGGIYDVIMAPDGPEIPMVDDCRSVNDFTPLWAGQTSEMDYMVLEYRLFS